MFLLGWSPGENELLTSIATQLYLDWLEVVQQCSKLAKSKKCSDKIFCMVQ